MCVCVVPGLEEGRDARTQVERLHAVQSAACALQDWYESSDRHGEILTVLTSIKDV